MDTLFVYGTLRQGSHHPVQQYLKTQARHVGTGWVRGRLYALDGYPGYIPGTGLREWVRGDLYEWESDRDALLSVLDAYEEASVSTPTAEYLRCRCLVCVAEGHWRTAWVYVYNWPVREADRILSGDWLSSTRS